MRLSRDLPPCYDPLHYHTLPGLVLEGFLYGSLDCIDGKYVQLAMRDINSHMRLAQVLLVNILASHSRHLAFFSIFIHDLRADIVRGPDARSRAV